MELIAWAIQVQLYKYRTFRIAPQEKVSSQCLTLDPVFHAISSKTLYNVLVYN
ncbi:MAG: hypothetical protein ACR5LA_08835 [Wolbachia sp.]